MDWFSGRIGLCVRAVLNTLTLISLEIIIMIIIKITLPYLTDYHHDNLIMKSNILKSR